MMKKANRYLQRPMQGRPSAQPQQPQPQRVQQQHVVQRKQPQGKQVSLSRDVPMQNDQATDQWFNNFEQVRRFGGNMSQVNYTPQNRSMPIEQYSNFGKTVVNRYQQYQHHDPKDVYLPGIRDASSYMNTVSSKLNSIRQHIPTNETVKFDGRNINIPNVVATSASELLGQGAANLMPHQLILGEVAGQRQGYGQPQQPQSQGNYNVQPQREQPCTIAAGTPLYKDVGAQGFGNNIPVVKVIGYLPSNLANTPGMLLTKGHKVAAHILEEGTTRVDMTYLQQNPHMRSTLVQVFIPPMAGIGSFVLVEERHVSYGQQQPQQNYGGRQVITDGRMPSAANKSHSTGWASNALQSAVPGKKGILIG